jgi:hypothetical protein
MKYPQQQFELLKNGLSVLSSHFEIANIHPCQLQYLLYQQASEGQKHNALFINETGSIVKGFIAEGKEGYSPLISFLNESNFPLYPAGCNDNHVETAVKSAIKAIKP